MPAVLRTTGARARVTLLVATLLALVVAPAPGAANSPNPHQPTISALNGVIRQIFNRGAEEASAIGALGRGLYGSDTGGEASTAPTPAGTCTSSPSPASTGTGPGGSTSAWSGSTGSNRTGAGTTGGSRRGRRSPPSAPNCTNACVGSGISGPPTTPWSCFAISYRQCPTSPRRRRPSECTTDLPGRRPSTSRARTRSGRRGWT